MFCSRRLLRHREDRRPVAFMLAFVLYQAAVFSLATRPLLAFVLVAVPHASLHVALMNVMHFSVHRPLFRNRLMEFTFGVACSMALGFTRSCFRLDHLAHHRHYLDPEKDTNRHIETGALRRQRYALRHLLTVYPRTCRMAWQAGRGVRYEYAAEAVAVLTLGTLLLLAKPGEALAVFAAPMVYNIFAVYYWSHHQHADLTSANPLAASRTYENRLFNWIAFNVGYHAAHHYRPGVHWSKLPALHQSLKDRIPEGLVLRSVPWFASDYRGSTVVAKER
jgi:beta-carotene hydroxylase